MKTIASFYTHPPADMLKLRLESNGVRVFLKDEFAGNIGSIAIATGGIKVQVPEDDIPIVRKLIESDSELRDMIFPQSERCPNCSSIHIKRKGKMHIGFILFAILCFTLPLMFHKPLMECNDCKHEWKKNET